LSIPFTRCQKKPVRAGLSDYHGDGIGGSVRRELETTTTGPPIVRPAMPPSRPFRRLRLGEQQGQDELFRLTGILVLRLTAKWHDSMALMVG
jgi:hypothetical protein